MTKIEIIEEVTIRRALVCARCGNALESDGEVRVGYDLALSILPCEHCITDAEESVAAAIDKHT